MVKFGGLEKDGKVIHIECTPRYYSDLPMKGLGKSMESVGIDEPVIITQSIGLNPIMWGYTIVEIDRRAYELEAEIKWMELPPKNTGDETGCQMWFSAKRKD